MALMERTLMALKLILAKFDIPIAEHLSIKQEIPNMDNVTAIVSLIQILHDLDYKIKFVYDHGYKIRSAKLTWEVSAAINEAKNGKLVLHKDMSLDSNFEYKIMMIQQRIYAPPNVPFTNQDWLYFVGFYNILIDHYTEEGIAHVLLKEKLDYLPYFMIAEQQITEVKSFV